MGKEERVDDGCSCGREVVVALRDELAHLVDEEAHPTPAQHRSQDQRPPVGDHKKQKRRGEESQATPQDVRDMQRIVADLRISGELEDAPGRATTVSANVTREMEHVPSEW